MIARFNGNVVPFADDATSTNRTVFGGVTQSDAIDDNLNADFKKGWEIVGLNDNPTREDFNAMGYTLGALISYLYEMGISEWNTSQNYRVNSRVIGSDGNLYKSLTGTSGTPNAGNNPLSDVVNWKSLEAVSLTGDQTITGIKSFSSKILAPNLAYKDTLVTINSWSYSGTTITLNVASHTFVTGDYIEVAGLTATTYPANGIQLVTSVTSTTIVFTLSATPTGTAGVTSATAKGYATVNGRVSESVGVNQTWQNVTSSRVAEVTYTNTTGKTIYIVVTGSTGTNNSVNGFINGTLYTIVGGVGNSSRLSVALIIPNNSTYRIDLVATTIAFWAELR